MFKFYYGCMGAGKTTEIIKTYDIYRRKGLDPVIIKPAIDTREGNFSGWGTTASRITKEAVPAYYYTDLKKELFYLNYGSILVDEAQFMSREDVHFLALVADKQQVPVLTYGLKTDVNGNLFEGSAALLALVDETKELESLCQIDHCQNKAIGHARFVNGVRDTSGASVVIEKGNVTYLAVCRKHMRE